MITGLTSGCFDLLHISHLIYLQRCRSRCDKLIVGVDSDEMVKASKGPNRPIIPDSERFDLINNLCVVHGVFILHKVQELDVMAKYYKINKLFKNESFIKSHDKIYGLIDGVELDIIPDIKGMVSTTMIINRIINHEKP